MRKIQFRSGYYYHIYNRGVNRQAIFFNDENWGYLYETFTSLLHIRTNRNHCLLSYAQPLPPSCLSEG